MSDKRQELPTQSRNESVSSHDRSRSPLPSPSGESTFENSGNTSPIYTIHSSTNDSTAQSTDNVIALNSNSAQNSMNIQPVVRPQHSEVIAHTSTLLNGSYESQQTTVVPVTLSSNLSSEICCCTSSPSLNAQFQDSNMSVDELRCMIKEVMTSVLEPVCQEIRQLRADIVALHHEDIVPAVGVADISGTGTNMNVCDSSGSYKNWNATHERLTLHKYIKRIHLLEVCNTAFTERFTDAASRNNIRKMFNFSAVVKVNRNKRFPAGDEYVNINSGLVSMRLQNIFKSLDFDTFSQNYDSVDQAKEGYYYTLNAFINAIMNPLSDNSMEIYNQVSFEKAFNLNWS